MRRRNAHTMLARGRGIGGMLDRAIGVISPLAGLKRAYIRQQMEQLSRGSGSYVGAKNGRFQSTWSPDAGSPDSDTLGDLVSLRSRSRDLVRNDPLAKGILETLSGNIAGRGVKPKSMPHTEALQGIRATTVDKWRRACDAAWKRWAEGSPDVYDRMDWNALSTMANRSALESGDSFCLITSIDRPGSPYATKLELIEADRVDTPFERASDDRLRGGVRVTKRNRPVGAYISRTHPGDAHGLADYRFVPRWDKGGREQLLQLLYIERPGQNRGVPVFAPSLTLFDQISNYIQSEVVKARVLSCISMVVTKKDPEGTAIANSFMTDDEEGKLEWMAPGQIEYLNEGEEAKMMAANTPGTSFDPFMTRLLRIACRGAGLPYEVGVLDFSKSNYSNTRAALIETRRIWECRQLTIVRWAQVIWERVIEEAWLAGDLPNVDLYAQWDALMRVKWTFPGWGWVDPAKDVQAMSLAVEKGFSSKTRESAKWVGEEWEDITRERELEKIREVQIRKELEDEHGIAGAGSGSDGGTGDGESSGDGTAGAGTSQDKAA